MSGLYSSTSRFQASGSSARTRSSMLSEVAPDDAPAAEAAGEGSTGWLIPETRSHPRRTEYSGATPGGGAPGVFASEPGGCHSIMSGMPPPAQPFPEKFTNGTNPLQAPD